MNFITKKKDNKFKKNFKIQVQLKRWEEEL